MAVFKDFNKAFDKAEKMILAANKAAAKKAATSTRAKLVKDVSKELGAKSQYVRRRTKIYKANEQGVVLSVATRQWFAAHEFKPKIVKVPTAKGMRYGASYQVKGKPRTTLPNSFVIYGKSNKHLIVHRKTNARYPLVTTVVNVFTEAILRKKDETAKHMVDSYKKNYSSELKFRTSKLK